MADLPDEIKQQFAALEFQPDLVRRVVVTWTNLKELEAMEAPGILLDEQRRLLAKRLNLLEAWCKNFFA
jgi:hypothetical protein